MRMLLVMVAVFASTAQANMRTTVYRCDGETPLAPVDPNYSTVYGDIMVGTHLVIVISSDSGESGWGCLLFSDSDGEYFSLNGRGYDSNRFNYVDSCLAAAGEAAEVWSLIGFLGMEGFEFFTDLYPISGDWFIFDYYAEQTGVYNLMLYDLNASMDTPAETLSLTHVRSCDFHADAIVNFDDFALMASQWRTPQDADPNSIDIPSDLNSDDRVDVNDLNLFARHWLERVDCKPADPNSTGL